MISRTRSRIATSNPSRREPSWPTSLTMLAFAMAYSSCALNLQSRDSGLSPLLTSQENTPSLFLQESGRSRKGLCLNGRKYAEDRSYDFLACQICRQEFLVPGANDSSAEHAEQS